MEIVIKLKEILSEGLVKQINNLCSSYFPEEKSAYQEVYEHLEVTLETIHFGNIDDISYEVNTTSPNFLNWEIIFYLEGDEKDLLDLLIEFFKLEDDMSTDGEINVVKRKLLFRKIETDKNLKKRFKDFFIKYFGIDDQIEDAFKETIKIIEYPRE